MWAVRGIDGPVRADVTVLVDPRLDGTQAHVTIQVDFRGHGMGKLIVPMVFREAGQEVPESCRQLKSRLETGPATAGPLNRLRTAGYRARREVGPGIWVRR